MLLETETTEKSGDDPSIDRHKQIYAIVLVIAILLSAVYFSFAYNRHSNTLSSEAIMMGESLCSIFHPEHIKELSGDPGDTNSIEYKMTKESLMRVAQEDNWVHFAYIMSEKDGKMLFLLDSEPPDSADYSPPGQIYEEATDEDWEPFRGGNTVLTKPVSDRWGIWISTLVPIKDQKTGKVVASFGIDYDAFEWNVRLWKMMIPDIIIIICFFALSMVLLRTWNQQDRLKKLTRRLAIDEALYQSLFEQMPIGVSVMNDTNWYFGSEFKKININRRFEQIVGRTKQQLRNLKWMDITHPEDLAEDVEKFRQFKNGEIKGYSLEKRFIKPDGSVIWGRITISPFVFSEDKRPLHLCLIEDITKRKEIAETLKESERNKAVLFSNLPGMAFVCRYDRNWTMEFVSAGCYSLTGYESGSLIKNSKIAFNEIVMPEYRDILWQEAEKAFGNKASLKYEYEIITAEGEVKWVLMMAQAVYDEKEKIKSVEGIILDITDRKKLEQRLQYQSMHDEATGLHNRSYLEEVLRREIKKDDKEKKALICINLSTMNNLTLTYGFEYKHQLMKRITSSLRVFCDKNQSLFITDETHLAFYVRGYKDRKEISALCQNISEKLERVLEIERIGAGIGVVEIESDNRNDIETIFKNLMTVSEKALDTMKREIGISFFDDEMKRQVFRDEEISRELSQIAAGERTERLFLQFQPIMELDSKKICCFEALARMKSENPKLVPPLEFIPIAEKTKLIVPLGDLIIKKSLEFLKKLEANGNTDISVSINISAIQMLREGFAENLISVVDEMGITHGNVALEFTESMFSSDFDYINGVLAKLRRYGIKTAIDDFGTGYSSFARERELNIDYLKIDKFFIDKIMVLESEETITADIISMAHKLGQGVVAEGVEYEMQLEYLKEHGCDKIQGYLISRPLDEDVAIKLLKEQENTKGEYLGRSIKG